ncbi:MAG: DUF429 domain-containing protein [Candidatus Binatia bacterium]
MTWLAGADGCRGGWVVVLVDYKAGKIRNHHLTRCPTFADILALQPKPEIIAIDIPIGLLDTPQPGGRVCDHLARKLLGRRASSVFSPPIRPMLETTCYEQVRTQGLSIQAFGILPKIREVDQLMTPELQRVVHESHPELTFMALAGTPMQKNKKTREGREERLLALEQGSEQLSRGIRIRLSKSLGTTRDSHADPSFVLSVAERSRRGHKEERFSQKDKKHRLSTLIIAAPDDIIDAHVLAWTAIRIKTGQARQVPAKPPLDQKGLRTEMWY